MNAPFEIDLETGMLRFAQVPLTLASKQPLAVFLGTDVGARAKRERGSDEWEPYSLRESLSDGQVLGVSLIFSNAYLAKIRFDYRSERESATGRIGRENVN